MQSWLFVPLLVIAIALRIYFRREQYSRMGRLWRLPVRTRGQLWSRIFLFAGIVVLGVVFALFDLAWRARRHTSILGKTSGFTRGLRWRVISVHRSIHAWVDIRWQWAELSWIAV